MAVPPYGTAINQALAKARTKHEDLRSLRDHAVATMALQGDLKGRAAQTGQGDQVARVRPDGEGEKEMTR